MPKINVYLPDDLATAVRQAGLPVSPICQRALAEAVRAAVAGREAVAVLRAADFDPRRHPETAARIGTRMTAHLRGALGRARELVSPRAAVGTEQLLAGVIDEPDNLGVQVLRSLDVDIADLRAAAVNRAGETSRRRSRPKPPSTGKPGSRRDAEPLAGLSAGARLSLAAALEGAIDLGHDFLGCEHLVLGLTEQDDPAADLLRDRGMTPESIRRAIPVAIGAAALGYRHGASPAGAVTRDRVAAIDRRLDGLEQRLQAGGL